MIENCPKCGLTLKSFEINLWDGTAKFEIPYCPKCEFITEFNLPQLIGVTGKAQRGINKTTGEFRMNVSVPENFNRDIIVRTFPSYRVTTPSEWRYGRRKGFYKTKERVSKVYPELKKNDDVSVIGIWQEGIPLLSILMHNYTTGLTASFIQEDIRVKKGILSSFSIKNPILQKSEELLIKLIEKTTKS